MVAWPILSGRADEVEHVTVSEKTQAYTTSKNLLVNGADAVERIMTSYKEVRRDENHFYTAHRYSSLKSLCRCVEAQLLSQESMPSSLHTRPSFRNLAQEGKS